MRIAFHHHPCADGFTAAWALHRADPSVRFLPYKYPLKLTEEGLPDGLRDDEMSRAEEVIFLDCCPPPEMAKRIAKVTRLTILDHHSGATEWAQEAEAFAEVVFDLHRSGAGLAWDRYVGGPRVPLVDLVEDRDLWRFRYKDESRNANALIFSHKFDFGTWDELAKLSMEELSARGVGIRRKHDKDVREILSRSTHFLVFPEGVVPVANMPYTMASDAAYLLLERHPQAPFAACYQIVDEKSVAVNLRSDNSREDVSVIAKRFNGGGHRNAAACTIPLKTFMELFP